MLDLPPLMSALATAGDPFADAVAAAREGCDAGLILHRPAETVLDAALVLAPEVPHQEAVSVVLAAEVGFADAFGAVAPPEIGLHLEWPGTFRVNSGRCGRLRAAASTADPGEVPDWLVLSLHVAMAREAGGEPGLDPDKTDLAEEGADVTAEALLSAWARNTLYWINVWEDGGMARLHGDWRGRAWGLGKEVELRLPSRTLRGVFVGLDERGGLLLQDCDQTRLIPLTEMLEHP